ncbi:MAG: DUF3575 domain-containing protein [Muribaculaceae bacterium]|nr:DUF3575 domain-containing protein [Muribaculaceae bacterium]
MKIILTSILTVLIAITAFGEIPADSVKVYFLAGRRHFDPSLGNNREAMESFIEKVKEAKAQDNINYLTVNGYASPEGASDANQRLSGLRCDEIAKYISQHAGIDNNQIKTFADGVAWEELRNLVAKHPDMPSQERVLYILDNTPLWIYNREKTKIIDGKKKQLMDLEGGRVWNWMMENLFPELRNAVAVVLYLKYKSETPAAVNTPSPDNSQATETTSTEVSEPSSKIYISDEEIETTRTDLIEEFAQAEYADSIATNVTSSLEGQCVSVMAQPKPFYMAVKTNMLYDAALVPNLGAEFYLGKNISIYGDWMYAWWENNARHKYWQVYGGDLGLRLWFGKKAHAKPLTGHHLGIYGGIFIFDFENGDTGYMGGKPGGTLWDRFLINSGIEYGYSLPIGKRLNIDFSIGFGYLSGNYIKYYPFDNDYYREKEYKMQYFGPTKAEISLVWLIGRGNTNHKKGGDK